MVLFTDEVKTHIEYGVSDEITLARKRAKKINMHITGKGVVEYLELLDGYENDAQKALREKLVKSNRSLFSHILRPIDKVFTAKGGNVTYNLPQETIKFVKDQITYTSDNLDIKRYLKKTVKLPYIIDANAVLFVDIDEKGALEPHVIFTDKILWYEHKGNAIEAIIFEGYKKDKEDGNTYYRVIDELTDRIFVRDGNGNIYEDNESTISNYFGYVPAMILGDEKNPNEDIFESIVADIIEDADGFLRRASVTNVHELAHLYPRYWSYAQACTRCEGEGEIKTEEEDGSITMTTCPSCGGTGHKSRTNPSDEIIIPIPSDGDTTITPNIAGYVSPDLDTSKFYEELKDGSKTAMFQAMWGTTYQQGGKRETATGRFIDVQPVQDRLKDISYTFQKLHEFLLDTYCKVILRNPQYQSSVTYGTRYILETADELLDKYIEGSREDISEIIELDLSNRYLEAEYQSDTLELTKRKKLMKIEPFPTSTIVDIMGMEGISDDDKKRKLYFSTWVGTLTPAQIIFFSEDQLRESLDKYISKISLKLNINTKTTDDGN